MKKKTKKMKKNKEFPKKHLRSWKIGFGKKKIEKKNEKKRISKKIFKVVKNKVLGKKVGKKKQNIFAEKNLEIKNVLEFFPKKHFWARQNNSPPPRPLVKTRNLFSTRGGGVNYSANSGIFFLIKLAKKCQFSISTCKIENFYIWQFSPLKLKKIMCFVTLNFFLKIRLFFDEI